MWSERLAPVIHKVPASHLPSAPARCYSARPNSAWFFGAGPRAGTSLLLFYLGKRLFNENVGLWTVIAFNVTPIFNVGAFVMTTDALSISFGSRPCFAFWLAIEKSPRFSFWWPLTGIVDRFGFLSRFTNAFEIVCVVLVLAFCAAVATGVQAAGLVLATGSFHSCTIPRSLDAQHAWITLRHCARAAVLLTILAFVRSNR